MAASVSLTINLRDGSKQTISHAVGGQDNHVVRYSELIQSLNYVQEQSNAVLTTLVNQEKSQKNGSPGNGEGTDEEEEEDSGDDETDIPPPDKKKKT